jgi:hypothetical protein
MARTLLPLAGEGGPRVSEGRMRVCGVEHCIMRVHSSGLTLIRLASLGTFSRRKLGLPDLCILRA